MNEDAYVIRAMMKYGGSFAHALGVAASLADEENLRRIKAGWPDYWEKYSNLARAVGEVVPLP